MIAIRQRLAGFAGLIICAVLLVAAYNWHQRTLGVEHEATVRAEAAATVARKAAADSGLLFRAALQRADSARGVYRQGEGGVRAAGEATAAALARFAAERDSAVRVLSDSLATVGQVKDELRRVLKVTELQVTAMSAERDSARRQLVRAGDVIAADSVALAAATHALASDAVAYSALEHELAAVKAERPGVLSRAAHGVATFATGAACAAGVYALTVTPVGAVVAVASAATGGALCAALAGAFR